MIIYSPKPTFVPSFSEIGDLSCITSCPVLPGFLMDTLLRARAQENGAKGGHSRKPNLRSFSVYREVLTSLQTSWGFFSEIWPIFGII